SFSFHMDISAWFPTFPAKFRNIFSLFRAERCQHSAAAQKQGFDPASSNFLMLRVGSALSLSSPGRGLPNSFCELG
ncbi:MAG: hypothetical protein IKE08_06005, partial [Clostridia bacterium]|nr:hypothetical protein [Clostridia bacterium]